MTFMIIANHLSQPILIPARVNAGRLIVEALGRQGIRFLVTNEKSDRRGIRVCKTEGCAVFLTTFFASFKDGTSTCWS